MNRKTEPEPQLDEGPSASGAFSTPLKAGSKEHSSEASGVTVGGSSEVDVEGGIRPPVPKEPCCALCTHSVQWAQELGQYMMRHPFFTCKCPAKDRDGFWRTPDAFCSDEFYELDPARLKPVKIAVPNKIKKKLII